VPCQRKKEEEEQLERYKEKQAPKPRKDSVQQVVNTPNSTMMSRRKVAEKRTMSAAKAAAYFSAHEKQGKSCVSVMVRHKRQSHICMQIIFLGILQEK
jgi:hypothetical protein